MTFELSPEHEQFRRSVRDFAEKEIAPHAAQWDRDHHFPTDVVHQMGQLGLMGLTAPEEFGGAGMAGEDGGFTSLCIAIEESGRVDQSMGITLEAAVGLGINPILTFGTAEQKETWLPALVAGEKIAGFGLTEPGAGSDAGATKTKAVLRSLRSSSRRARRASPPRRPTTSSAGTPPTRTRCPSRTPASPSPTCSVRAVAATRSSSPPSTTVASRSPPSRSAA